MAALRPPAGTVRVPESSLRSSQTLSLSYTDPEGRAFHLTFERNTAVETATYDANGSLGNRGGGRGQTRELRHQRTDLEHSLRGAADAVRGFRQLLHRMLKTTDPAYAARFADFDPWGAKDAGPSFDTAIVTDRLTISMDVVDPEYWSVENTAGRLKDFAVALYAGSDRQAHREKMARAMEQGYGEAQEAFGGFLPDIARETIERAKEMLSAWAGQPEAPTEAAAGPSLLDRVA